MSRTVLDDFVLGDIEKEYLLKLIRRLSSIYFAEVLGFVLFTLLNSLKKNVLHIGFTKGSS